MEMIVKCKQVLFGPTTWRWVFTNPRTGYQVAVLSCDGFGQMKLSIPVEGMGGWHVYCEYEQEAWEIANFECYKRGKLFNRFVNRPRFFLHSKLS